MDENKGCNGRCENCDVNQRTYCSAQMAYYNRQDINAILAILANKNTQGTQSIITMDKEPKNGESNKDNDDIA